MTAQTPSMFDRGYHGDVPGPEKGDDPAVFGATVDDRTRCVHWHSDLDVVAIEFACCRMFYACRECHDEGSGHEAATWPRSERDRAAVLCGVCRRRMTIEGYLASDDRCPSCGAGFNPGCRLHHHLYFSSE
jgi:uncharacterized CHY-type Zn-finger protein